MSDDLTEVVATFERDGKRYEIDDLGILHPKQWGQYAVYRDGQMVAVFDHGADLTPEHRPAKPTTDELIVMANQALAVEEAHDLAGVEPVNG